VTLAVADIMEPATATAAAVEPFEALTRV